MSKIRKVRPANTLSIRRSNTLGKLINPKSSTHHCHKPLPGMEKAVFGLSSSAMLTWWKSLFKSNVENHLDPPRASKVSSILGKGWLSGIVNWFSLLLSMQNLVVPSRLGTKTAGANQAEWDGSTSPFSVIAFISFSANSLLESGILYGLSLTGLQSGAVLIVCSTKLVLPKSCEDLENWSFHWYNRERNFSFCDSSIFEELLVIRSSIWEQYSPDEILS